MGKVGEPTWMVPSDPDALAPDGSEIRLLASVLGGSMVHCRVPAGSVTLAVRHRTVEELWLVLSGRGEIWRKQGSEERTDILESGTSLALTLGTHFQFRNVGTAPLDIAIVTMPPWPGMAEAERVEDHWKVPSTIAEGVGAASLNRSATP